MNWDDTTPDPNFMTHFLETAKTLYARAKSGKLEPTKYYVIARPPVGYDIHLHIEIQVNGKWLHYRHPAIERNYYLFCKMAGVRKNDRWAVQVDPITTGRKYPIDITETTLFDWAYCAGDAHSESWLDSDEIVILAEWCQHFIDTDFNEIFGYLFGNGYRGFKEPGQQDRYPSDLEDFRFIFWFDN
jgi:hypothetical protein